jgi:hypothetical protein
VPDGCELAGHDCNSNRAIDSCDIASGASRDCNGNAIPDECEYDCNSTGIPDGCDIATGKSPDCDANGVPDECDLVPRIDFEPSSASPTRAIARHVETVDLDGDGHGDLLRVELPLGASVLWGRGDGTFEEPTLISETPGIHCATAGDLDRDGDLDLAIGNGIDATVLTFFQLSPRTFREGEMSRRGGPPCILAAGDLDGDGDTDIVGVDGTNSVPLRGVQRWEGIPRRGPSVMLMIRRSCART